MDDCTPECPVSQVMIACDLSALDVFTRCYGDERTARAKLTLWTQEGRVDEQLAVYCATTLDRYFTLSLR